MFLLRDKLRKLLYCTLYKCTYTVAVVFLMLRSQGRRELRGLLYSKLRGKLKKLVFVFFIILPVTKFRCIRIHQDKYGFHAEIIIILATDVQTICRGFVKLFLFPGLRRVRSPMRGVYSMCIT